MKQVILVRTDLKLPKGKMAAQVAHASVEALLKTISAPGGPDRARKWRNEGMMKVVLKVENKEDLYKYAQLAKDQHMPVGIITDAGKTVVAPGTVTCACIGPAEEEDIDAITGDLGLM